jgi:hypothetical protein
MELTYYLVQRYDTGKRVRAQYIFANEDRMPLRDGPSPGLVMHPSIMALKGNQLLVGIARKSGPLTAPRMVESKTDMATAQDLSRDTTLTSIVEEDDDLIEIEPTSIDSVVVQPVGDSTEPGGVVTPEPPEPDMQENGDDGIDSGPMTAMPDLEPLASAMPSLQSQDDELPECVPSEQKTQQMQVQMQGQTKKRSKPAKEPREEPEAKIIEPIVEKRATRASTRNATARYQVSDLYKPKPMKEGTEVQTKWGTAEVHKALINGDVELTWQGHDEAGVRTIKASDMGKLAWLPEEKEERYDYAGNRLADVERAQLVYALHAEVESKDHFVKGKFLGFKITDLVGNVRAAAVNSALPQPDHRLGWDHPFQELVKPAKEKELTGLCEKGTFGRPIELPKGHKRIPVMFVNGAKDDDKGMFEKIKSRLTVMGNKMKGQVSEADAYSPVTHPMSYKIILILHLNDPKVDFDVYDVEQAFLSVGQERELYVGHPKGYAIIVDRKGRVTWRELKPGELAPKTAIPVLLALYGSVESGRLFFKGWVEWHLEYGFNTIHYDKCYLVLNDDKGHFIKMSYHVDDGLVAHKGAKMWRRYRAAISQRFVMKYQSLEDKKKFLGMRFHLDRKRGLVHIEQSALIMKMLMQFDMQDCSTAVQSPFLDKMPTKADIPEDEGELLDMQKSYDMYAAIGYLNYLQMGTRLDISCSLKVLSQFAAKFGKAHVALAQHMMRWLKKTINHQITLFGVESPQIQLFTDCSHASNPDTRKSITAVIGKLGGNTIFWKCLYQTIVSHSSCESELMALDKGATMGMFLRWLTEALGGTVITPVPIFVDNQGTISLANNPVGPNRNLHIHARYFYVRNLVDGKEYVVHYVNTKDQLADMLCTYKGSASFVRFWDLASRCAILVKDENGVWVWKILR